MGNEESKTNNPTVHAIGYRTVKSTTNIEDNKKLTKRNINMQKANSKQNIQQPQQQQQPAANQKPPLQKSGQNNSNPNGSTKNLNNNQNNMNNNNSNKKPNQPQQQPQASKTNPTNSNSKNNFNNQINDNNRSRNLSSHSQESFGRIVKRQLWWHESESDKKVPLGSLPKFEAAPKVDDKSNWSPSRSSKKIETVKLNWKAQPVLNTKENLNYVPGGGNKRYPTEHLEWNANHKVDTGFVYEFE